MAAARISTVAAFFGVNIVAARLLSPDELGTAAVGQTIGMIAALVANGGLNISTIYFLQQRPAARASIAPGLTALASLGATLAAVLVLASAPLVAELVLSASAWPLFISAALLGAATIGFEFSGALLLGIGQRGRFAVAELLRGWGVLVAVTLLILLLRGGHALVLGMAVGYALSTLLSLVWAGRTLPLRPRLDREVGTEAIGFGLRGQVGNIFQFLGVRLDLLLVPAFLDLTSAGIYFVAVRVSDVVGQVATASASLVFPQVASQADRRSTAMTERVARLTLLVVIGSAVAIGLIAEPLLGVAFGEAYRAGTTALLISLVAVVPLSLGRLIAADLKGRGRPGLVSVTALLSVLATIVLDVALIPVWGIVGAAMASLVTYSLTTVALLGVYRSVTDGRLADLVPRAGDLRQLSSMARLKAATGRGDR